MAESTGFIAADLELLGGELETTPTRTSGAKFSVTL